MSPSPKAEEQPGVSLVGDRREEGSVWRLIVRVPGKLNVLGESLIEELQRQLDVVADEAEARVLVLTGGGERAFIGGADVRELAKLDPARGRRFITSLHEVCQRLREMPLPVIARIRGHCLGAGLEVAACCDIRVATPDSRFGMPEVRVGVPSVIEAAVLPRLIGGAAAHELMLTGRIVDGEEAARLGLVQRLALREDLDSAIEALVDELLLCAPRALALQKELFRRWQELPLSEAIAAGIEVFGRAYASDEPYRYQRAFLERRRPPEG